MPPIIGITAGWRALSSSSGDVPGFAVLSTYVEMVGAAGAIPVLLPPVTGDGAALLDRIDALILSGGGDVDPTRYGGAHHETVYGLDQMRDEFEIDLARSASERRLPTLCICRGMQVMNVALGGTLIEDIPWRLPRSLTHFADGEAAGVPQHLVEISAGSATAKVLGSDRLEVNSIHHQSVDVVAPTLTAVGHAPDGVVEAIEPRDDRWAMWAVQWHPEYLGRDHAPSLRLFEALVTAAE